MLQCNIIDADSLAFKASKETYDQSIDRFIFLINDIRNKVPAKREIFLISSGRNTFRDLIYPDYKGNRKGKEYPEFVPALKKFMVEELNAVKSDYYEADDAASIIAHLCRESNLEYVVSHIDSDLKQIPGVHYDYGKGLFYSITEEEAKKELFKQILTGAAKDNIPGLRGFGIGAWDKIKHRVNTIFDVENIYKNGIIKNKSFKQKEVKGLGEGYFDYFTLQVGLTTLLTECEDVELNFYKQLIVNA
jgi:5'-3' exonuclease